MDQMQEKIEEQKRKNNGIPGGVQQHVEGVANRDGAFVPMAITIGYFDITTEVPRIQVDINFHPSLEGLIEVS